MLTKIFLKIINSNVLHASLSISLFLSFLQKKGKGKMAFVGVD
jgi:hypothetical protein